MYIYICIYIYGSYIEIYGFFNIRTGILDYLREGFPWPARPLKHTDSKYTNSSGKVFRGSPPLANIDVMEVLWSIYDRFMEDSWKIYGGFMEDLWWIYGGFMVGLCWIYG